MHEELNNVCKSLDDLAIKVSNAWSDNRTLLEAFGWNNPALTRHDLAALPQMLSERIKESTPEDVDDELIIALRDIPKKLSVLQSTIPYMFNGNGAQAVPAYISTIHWVEQILIPLIGWQVVYDHRSIPISLKRSLRSIQAEISEITPEKEALKSQIKLIHQATTAAESLPQDLQSLREARNKVENLSSEATELSAKINESTKQVIDATKYVLYKKEETDKLVQQCEEAYKITTTKGLAAAFDQRASRLGKTMWVWVGGLMTALVIGAYIGAHKIELISEALSQPIIQWNAIWLHIFLSIISIGGPLWFAWLATKQIGQRFRLSEDYAFKASVAKAYEGYRREAARIDEKFEARLFSSALSRLEEAPLRLVEQESHGSPWHELVSSKPFQNALEAVPELKNKFLSIASNLTSKNLDGISNASDKTIKDSE